MRYKGAANEHVLVDECNAAAGTFWCGHWQYLMFDCDQPAASPLHINFKEICAVVSAVDRWAYKWRGKSVVIHTDSMVTKSVLKGGWCRNAYVNSLLRKLAFVCARLATTLTAMHVAGVKTLLPETISRLHEKGKTRPLHQLLSRSGTMAPSPSPAFTTTW